MNALPSGGETLDARHVLTVSRSLGLLTGEGTQYRSKYHAGQRLAREAAARPTVAAAVGLDLPTVAVLKDGTARITIYTYGLSPYNTGRVDNDDNARAGTFNFNVGMRHLCGCGRADCIARDGSGDGNYTGSLCGTNHPNSAFMPLTEVREGADYHRTLNLPRLTASGVVKGHKLTERVGGGFRAMNPPQYRRNRDFRTVGGCPSCGRGQCWGTVKRTGQVCFDSMKFAFVNVAGVGWVFVYIDPNAPDFSEVRSILDGMGSRVLDVPVMGAV